MSAGGVRIAPGRNLSGEAEDSFDAARFEDPFGAAGFEDCFDWSCFEDGFSEDGFCASWFIADSWSGRLDQARVTWIRWGLSLSGRGKVRVTIPRSNLAELLSGSTGKGSVIVRANAPCIRSRRIHAAPSSAGCSGRVPRTVTVSRRMVISSDSGAMPGTSAARIAPSGLVHRFNIGN